MRAVLLFAALLSSQCYCIDGQAQAEGDDVCSARNLPDFSNYGDSNGLPESIQAIIPQYSFNCSGTVTGWGAFVQGGPNDTKRIDFQVWRSVDSREYELVGFNSFPGAIEEGRMLTNLDEMMKGQPLITVQSGDVIGIYMERSNGGWRVQETSLQSPSVTVYHTPAATPLFTTTGDTLTITNAYTTCVRAPVITVTVSMGDSGGSPGLTGALVGLFVTLLVIAVVVCVVIVVLVTYRKQRMQRVKLMTAQKSGAAELTNPNYSGEVLPSSAPRGRVKTGSCNEYSTVGSTSCYYAVGDAKAAMPAAAPFPIYEDVVKTRRTTTASSGDHYTLIREIQMGQGSKDTGGEYHYASGAFKSVGIPVPTTEARIAADNHYEMQEFTGYHKLKFFEQSSTYWSPASTASELYSQLSRRKYRELPRQSIKLKEDLGAGQFGSVVRGVWTVSDSSVSVAVKTLKQRAGEGEKVKLLQEAAIMGQFSHPHVVRLLGVVTIQEPVMMVLEFMEKGDLKTFLLDLASDMSNNKTDSQWPVQKQFLRFASHIAKGMNYLSKKSFVHRDLAARNVLLSGDLICKIGDFGLSRDLMQEAYYTSNGGKVPIRWTAPEALNFRKYSSASDAWSYGMVLYEIWSLGKKPFPSVMNEAVLRAVEGGYINPPPPGCPRLVYSIMVQCWNVNDRDRPSFSKLVAHFKKPDSLLLYWSEQDRMVSHLATLLGSDIHSSQDLYPDLQNCYGRRR